MDSDTRVLVCFTTCRTQSTIVDELSATCAKPSFRCAGTSATSCITRAGVIQNLPPVTQKLAMPLLAPLLSARCFLPGRHRNRSDGIFTQHVRPRSFCFRSRSAASTCSCCVPARAPPPTTRIRRIVDRHLQTGVCTRILRPGSAPCS